MSAGHHHAGERAASALADKYYESAAPLISVCTVNRDDDVPWLANRSRDLKTVYIDRRVPRILKCGIDTGLSLPWHEIPEGQAMDDGLPYDKGDPSAHCDVATPLERREVERQKPDDPDIWIKYEEEMNGYVRAVDDESIERVPQDMDLRVFAEDDRALLEKIIAAQAAEEKATHSRARRQAMPQLLKPSDVAQRLKAGEKPDGIFGAAGARKAKLVGIEASVNAAGTDRAVDFTISTGALDRYNSTIAVDGWNTDAFKRNPVVLWAHDDSIPAIARGGNVRVTGGKVVDTAIFADRDTHPLADTIYNLIRGKFIGAASVGWIPLDWKFTELGDQGYRVDYLAQELLEWSVVNIPANPECLVGARSLGIDTSPLLHWAERALDLGGFAVVSRDELVALRKAAGAPEIYQLPDFLSRRARRDPADGDASDWKCGAARDLEIVDDDSWDGPEAEKAIFSACGFDGDKPDTARARQAFLAYDASAPEKRGSYKLPFAKVADGKFKASKAALAAANQRLSGTDIPQPTKEAAQEVIDHYKAKLGADKNFEASAAALRTLFDNGQLTKSEFIDRLMRLARAGRVISAENEKKLRAAHDHVRAAGDHCAAAVEHVRAVIDQVDSNCDPDDPDCDPDDPDCDPDGADPEQNAARDRRVRLLRLATAK